MIVATVDNVEVRQATREYTRTACGHKIRLNEWVAGYEVFDKKGKRSEARYCEMCAIVKGIARAHEDRPRKAVRDLSERDRIVTQIGVRTVIRRMRDSRDGRPMFMLGNSRGELTGYFIFDSEDARVVLA